MKNIMRSLFLTFIICLCVSKTLMYFTALLIIHPRNYRAASVLTKSKNILALQETETLNLEILEKNILAAKGSTRHQAICDGIILLLVNIACIQNWMCISKKNKYRVGVKNSVGSKKSSLNEKSE